MPVTGITEHNIRVEDDDIRSLLNTGTHLPNYTGYISEDYNLNIHCHENLNSHSTYLNMNIDIPPLI
jgi:hypothetical protein